MERGRDFIIGLVLGATIGALAALLLAPQSGAETRRMIMEKGSQFGERVKDMSSAVKDKTEQMLVELKKSVEELKRKLSEKTAKSEPKTEEKEGTTEEASEGSVA